MGIVHGKLTFTRHLYTSNTKQPLQRRGQTGQKRDKEETTNVKQNLEPRSTFTRHLYTSNTKQTLQRRGQSGRHRDKEETTEAKQNLQPTSEEILPEPRCDMYQKTIDEETIKITIHSIYRDIQSQSSDWQMVYTDVENESKVEHHSVELYRDIQSQTSNWQMVYLTDFENEIKVEHHSVEHHSLYHSDSEMSQYNIYDSESEIEQYSLHDSDSE